MEGQDLLWKVYIVTQGYLSGNGAACTCYLQHDGSGLEFNCISHGLASWP